MTFRVYRDAAGLYRWRLIAKNGRIVADSGEGYADLDNAVRAVRAIKKAIGDAAIEGA